MKILITGCAGFIGFSLSRKLLADGHIIIGVDNINSYYSKSLKYSRLKILKKYKSKFKFYKYDISNKKKINKIFLNKIDIVVNLAAQAGVRYSIIKPDEYFKNNVNGFYNILSISRKKKIKHFIYASTSSVYGENNNYPLDENQSCENPIQFYAATKCSNELMAKSFSKVYNFRTTGLRFFTVYGPWGRPDMALFKFTKNIFLRKKIQIFNSGNHKRDFTYIDDIIDGIQKIIEKKNVKRNISEIINLGNSKSINLMRYIKVLEKEIGIKSHKKYLKKQPGDIVKTFSSIKKANKLYAYKPKVDVKEGIKRFVKWYKEYYKK